MIDGSIVNFHRVQRVSFMGSLHHLPTATTAHARLLDQLVGEMIGRHPDKAVAEKWAKMARESMLRYPGPPLPSQPVLGLDTVENLDLEQKNQLLDLTQEWLESYFNDVRNQMMEMHRDLLGLQRRVAEFEKEIGRH